MSAPPRRDFSELIVELVERVVAKPSSSGRSSGLFEISAELRLLPGIETRDGVEFRFNEYEIFTGLKLHLDSHAEALEEVRGFEISAAPVVVANLAIADEGNVLVTRYWACPGEMLLPVASIQGPFRAEARERFRLDMTKLADQKMIHPYARGFQHWLVSEKTGVLVLNSWSALRRARPSESMRWLQDIDDLLRSRS